MAGIRKGYPLFFLRKTVDVRCTVCYTVFRKEVERMKDGNKKSPINWTDLTAQAVVGFLTGLILLIIDKLWK